MKKIDMEAIKKEIMAKVAWIKEYNVMDVEEEVESFIKSMFLTYICKVTTDTVNKALGNRH